MIGLLLLAVCVLAAAFTYDSPVFVFAVANAAVYLWAYGVLRNHAKNPEAAPDWTAWATFAAGAVGIGLLIYGIFF